MLARPLRFLSVALLVLGTTAPAEADAAEPSAPPAAIDRFVRGWMAANGVPGLALAVTRDVRIVHLRGYGDAGNGRPVTPDTQFLVASLSKSFTALAVLQLVQAGRVNLDAPVAAYLPGSPWPTGPKPPRSRSGCCSTRPVAWPTPGFPR